MTSRTFARLLPFFLILASCSSAPTRPENISKGDYETVIKYVSDSIRAGMKADKVTGLSIALVDDVRVIWSEGFGWADEEAKVPARPETLYIAGSVTKLFTAAAIMQLRDAGKLDIDRPFKEYVPEFSIRSRFPDARPFTIRDMLTHHSGLPGDRFNGDFVEKPQPPDSLVRLMSLQSISSPPGTIFAYSNLAYSLLGVLAEKTAGRAYATLVGDSILSPLGMTASSFAQARDGTAPVAKTYRRGKPSPEHPMRDIAAGGLWTNVMDLARFMRMVFGGGELDGVRIVKRETLEEMLRPQNENMPLDLDFRIGLGWQIAPPGKLGHAGKVAWHNGSTLHHKASFIALADHKIGAIALAASATAGPLLDRLCAEAAGLLLEARTGIRPVKRPPPKRPAEEPSRAALAAHDGAYATGIGVARVEAVGDGRITAKTSGGTLRLTAVEGGRFLPEYMLAGLIPIKPGEMEGLEFSFKDVEGLHVLAVRRNAGWFPFGTRIAPAPIGPEWAARTGAYELVNKNDNQLYLEGLRLAVEKELLIIEFSVPSVSKERARLALLPISDKEAVTAGYGRYLGETITASDGPGAATLSFSGFVFRKRK